MHGCSQSHCAQSTPYHEPAKLRLHEQGHPPIPHFTKFGHLHIICPSVHFLLSKGRSIESTFAPDDIAGRCKAFNSFKLSILKGSPSAGHDRPRALETKVVAQAAMHTHRTF